MKKVWIILIVVVIVSLAVLAAGSLFMLYSDDDGLHISNRNAAEIFTDKSAKKFDEIEIRTTSSNIEFITADRFGYEYMANAALKTVCTNENSKLTISQDNKQLLFNFSFWRRNNDYVKIYLPETAQMKNVTIKNISGNITIAKLTADKLDIHATSGNADIENIQATGVIIDKTSGNFTIDGCKADNLNVNLTSGQFKAKSLDLGGMTLKVTSGNAELGGKLLGANDITSISGNVTLNVQGEKKDYNSNISVVSGNVTVDGNSTKTYEYENADAANSLKIIATSGNVTVNFKGQ